LAQVKLTHFDHFLTHLHGHPISDPLSKECSILNDIGKLFDVFRSGSQIIPSHSSTPNTTPTPLSPHPAFIVEIPTRSTKRKHLNESSSSQHPLKRLKPSLTLDTWTSPSPEPSHYHHSTSGAQSDAPGHKQLLNLIDELYPLLGSETPTNLTEKMAKVKNSPDAWLPFRECAPSRRRVLEPDGPFDSTFLCTVEGLFSILIWRGITFGCRVVHDHPTRFNNLAEWMAIANAHKDDPTYLCCINAYTTPNNGRSAELAVDYWTAVQAVENDRKTLISDSELSYTKLFSFFVQDKKEKPKVPKGGWPKRALGELLPYSCQNGLFPQIGRLTAHLLAADCHYALLGRSPSAEEMGKTIYTLDMGALNGMQKLGSYHKVHTTLFHSLRL
jgi:hypothetical protein